MEDPGYFGAIDAFTSAGARLVPVPVDDEGLEVTEGRRRAGRARLAYLTPTHQFPLGVVMSHPRRLAAPEWARESGAYLLEYDCDSELRFAVPAILTLQSLDRAGRVFVVGTFNKLLFPAVRLGYIVLPPALVDEFLAFRLRTDIHTVEFDQAVLADEAPRHLRGLLDISPVREWRFTAARGRSCSGSRCISLWR